jgi:hypothetical protein
MRGASRRTRDAPRLPMNSTSRTYAAPTQQSSHEPEGESPGAERGASASSRSFRPDRHFAPAWRAESSRTVSAASCHLCGGQVPLEVVLSLGDTCRDCAGSAGAEAGLPLSAWIPGDGWELLAGRGEALQPRSALRPLDEAWVDTGSWTF